MTTLLVALSLFISCFETTNNFIEVVPPVEVDVVSAQSNGWEYIGDVHLYSSNGGSYGDGKLYVKAMGNRLFYKVVRYGDEYTVISNPDYGKSQSSVGKYKYMAGGSYYLNLPE